MYEVYRVRKGFGWDGWQYRTSMPLNIDCDCAHYPCSYRVGNECRCRCMCGCAKANNFGGNILVVQERHPRIHMIAGRLADYDSCLDREALLKLPRYQELTTSIEGVGAQRQKLYYDF